MGRGLPQDSGRLLFPALSVERQRDQTAGHRTTHTRVAVHDEWLVCRPAAQERDQGLNVRFLRGDPSVRTDRDVVDRDPEVPVDLDFRRGGRLERGLNERDQVARSQ